MAGQMSLGNSRRGGHAERVFHEVDEALRSLLRAEVLGDAQIEIAFDPPNRPWIGAVKGPTINLFLYDVREDTARRDVMLEPVLDEAGKIIGRRAPAHRYDLYYLASVWAPTVALEHHILSALTAGLVAHEMLPEEHLSEDLRQQGRVLLAAASGMKRGMPGNFGGELKFQLEIVVTVPMPAKVDMPVAKPVDSPLTATVTGPDGQRERVEGRPAQPAPAVLQQRAQAGATPPGVRPDQARQDLARAAAASPRAPGAPAETPRAAAPGAPRPAAGTAPTRPPPDPMAQVRAAMAQAAQVQANLAQAQAALARALAGPQPAASQPAASQPAKATAPPAKATKSAPRKASQPPASPSGS